MQYAALSGHFILHSAVSNHTFKAVSIKAMSVLYGVYTQRDLLYFSLLNSLKVSGKWDGNSARKVDLNFEIGALKYDAEVRAIFQYTYRKEEIYRYFCLKNTREYTNLGKKEQNNIKEDFKKRDREDVKPIGARPNFQNVVDLWVSKYQRFA